MPEKLERSADGRAWVWVVVIAGAKGDELLALSGQAGGKSFVPAFRTKDEGLLALGRLANPQNQSRELQAMAAVEVVRLARESGFKVWLVDREGRLQGELDESV